MRLLPAAARAVVPWRNGAGVTREVAADKPGADFGWRVSVATLDRDAPFSRFDGCARTFVLARGGPVTLIGPAWRRTLAAGDRLSFADEEPVVAEVEAPAVAVNLITRRNAYTHHIVPLRLLPAAAVLLRTQAFEWQILLSLAELTLDDMPLAPFDAVLLAPNESARLAGSGEALALHVIPKQAPGG